MIKIPAGAPDDIIYHINLLGQKKDDRGTIDCKSNSKWNGNAKIAVRIFGSLNDPKDMISVIMSRWQFHGKNLILSPTLVLNWGLILVMVIAEYSLIG